MTDSPSTKPDTGTAPPARSGTGGGDPEPTAGARPQATPNPAARDAAGRLQRASDFPLTLTRALLETLELRRILYVILSGTTAGDGLGFNRAFLWLEDEGGRALRGQLAVGPASQEEASRIWEAMEAEQFDLARVMARYDAFAADPDASCLARTVEPVAVPLPLVPEGAPVAEAGSFLGLLARVMTERRPLGEDRLEVPVPDSTLVLSHFAMAPLLLGERCIGVLAVDNAYNGRPIDPGELHDLQTLANLAAVAVERARLYARLRRMADVDGLTGLLNRRRFDERLAELVTEARRHGEPLAVLMVDADRFKEINDRHGHLTGDDVLRGLAEVILGRLRQGDIAARYGGDELVAVLPRATGPEALQVARALCRRVQEIPFGAEGDLRTSVSIGVAALTAHHGEPAALLAAADEALYRAKEAGRGQARLHGVPEDGRP